MFTKSIVALITPFSEENQNIDFDALEALVERQIEQGSDGLVVCGTTGEVPTLSEIEVGEVVKRSVTVSRGRIHVIVNVGTYSTKKSVERAEMAKFYGASGLLATVPYYNKPPFRGIVGHFEKIAAVGLPLIVYHHPGRTGITLTAKELVEIHSIDNIVGIKDCSYSLQLTSEIISLMPKAVILSGNDDIALDVIQRGGKGAISVIGNLLPKPWGECIRLAVAGKIAEAKKRYASLKSLIEAIELEVNPQGIKCAMSLLGLCNATLRLPLVSVTQETKAKIERALEKIDMGSLIT